MIRKCMTHDFIIILSIINNASRRYKDIIPNECWHEPYMSAANLQADITDGVEFFGYEENGTLLGVMGIQYFTNVTLIRHAYVLDIAQGKGIGSKLLQFLLAKAKNSVLIGTWRDTDWSIRFYKKHGFRVLEKTETALLLRKYWKASETHFNNSVVLADDKYKSTKEEK